MAAVIAAIGLLTTPGQATASGPLAVRYISQYGHQLASENCDCGPAAVAMVTYYVNGNSYPSGTSSDDSLVAKARQLTGNTGPCTGPEPKPADTTGNQLIAAVHGFGFSASAIATGSASSEVQAIQDATDAGRPVISLVNAGDLGHTYTAGHWVVVRGFSADGQTVYINDPDWNTTTGTYQRSRSTFQLSISNSGPYGGPYAISVSAGATGDGTPPVASWDGPAPGSTIASRTVSLQAHATDAGGSHLANISFSAKWNGSWHALTTNSVSGDSASTSYTFDLCNWGVPDGDLELGLEARDNAGNHYTYSDHYANHHVTKSFNCSGGSSYAVNLWVNGLGYVSSSPGGLSCGHNSGCSSAFAAGTQVTLTAHPDSGSTFSGWSQGCSGTSLTCTLAVTAAINVQATFSAPPQTYALNLWVNGHGSVSSNPGGLSCGHDSGCSASFASGTTVTLTATADSGSTFAGWSQACSGTSLSCTVSMSSSKDVQATFSSPPRMYAVNLAVHGGGIVSSSPGGLACGHDSGCSNSFPAGTSVTLTATPDSGKAFQYWSQGCSGTSSTCTFTLNGDTDIQAYFGSLIAINLATHHLGSVTSDPPGLSCGHDGSCSAQFVPGTVVTLTAHPDSGQSFQYWSQACSGSSLTCQLTMDSSKDVQAYFSGTSYALNVAVHAFGQVSSSPNGLSCHGEGGCSASFPAGTQVTLTATPDGGHHFEFWSQACDSYGSSTTCVVTMNSDKDVQAYFDGRTFAINVWVHGDGQVSSDSGGLSCGHDTGCSASFLEGQTVHLNASADGGQTFQYWAQACGSGNNTQCTLSMSTGYDVQAYFTTSHHRLVVHTHGNGSVTSTPSGITCGSDSWCEALFNANSQVTLTATPGPNNVVAWSGPCSVSGATCTVTMSDREEVTATFSLRMYALNISTTGSGTVSTTISGAGLSCGHGSTCSATVGAGTAVTLTATPDAGQTFLGWGGTCSGTSTTCAFSMNANVSVQATFSSPQQLHTVSVNVGGAGVVSSDPAGLNCGHNNGCSNGFVAGTTVVLTASPDAGTTFGGWSGACSGGSLTCTITPDADVSVAAVFTEPMYTVELDVTGSGSVSSAYLSCGYGTSCSNSVPSGTTISFAPSPGPGQAFTGWFGDCAGVGACTVTVTRDTYVGANFASQSATPCANAVIPDLTEGNAGKWGTFASDGATRSVRNSTVHVHAGHYSLRFITNSGYDTGVKYPRLGAAHWDLTQARYLCFWEYASDASPSGFQGDQPIVVLKSRNGSVTYTPNQVLMFNGQEHLYVIPLAGDSTWTRTSSGSFSLGNVTKLLIHHDTWDFGFKIWFDGVMFTS